MGLGELGKKRESDQMNEMMREDKWKMGEESDIIRLTCHRT